jgi:predicted DNA-binding transcriptional regulator AlpA
VRHRSGLSIATIHPKMEDGSFPQRRKLSVRVVDWYEADVDAWAGSTRTQRRRRSMALTDLQVRKAQLHEEGYKLADSGGLYLFVTPAGARSWRMKYRYADKEKVLTFGIYPQVSLATARAGDPRAAPRRSRDRRRHAGARAKGYPVPRWRTNRAPYMDRRREFAHDRADIRIVGLYSANDLLNGQHR